MKSPFSLTNKHIIFFDGHCNLCSRLVQILLRIDNKKQFNFCSLQSDFGKQIAQKHQLTAELKSIYLLDKNLILDKSRAVFRICALLGFPWNVLQVFQVMGRRINDKLYDFVARNRYKWFGRSNACKMNQPGFEGRFMT